MSECSMFHWMIPLLPPAAVSLCRLLVWSLPADVFTQIVRLLLIHCQLDPLAVLQLHLSRRPDSYGHAPAHEYSAAWGEKGYSFIFVNLLADVVREVVSSMESLDEMTATGTTVFQAKSLS